MAGTLEFICVQDEKHPEGQPLTTHEAAVVRRRGGAVLPARTGVIRRCSVSGYHRRGFGFGVPLPEVTPGLVAPLMLYAEPGTETVWWAARIEGIGGKPPRGRIYLSGDSSQQMVLRAGVQGEGIALADLGEPDKNGGWNIFGSARFVAPQAGFYGFALWGSGLARVLWAAVSRT
jgi:hypothetical protein